MRNEKSRRKPEKKVLSIFPSQFTGIYFKDALKGDGKVLDIAIPHGPGNFRYRMTVIQEELTGVLHSGLFAVIKQGAFKQILEGAL